MTGLSTATPGSGAGPAHAGIVAVGIVGTLALLRSSPGVAGESVDDGPASAPERTSP